MKTSLLAFALAQALDIHTTCLAINRQQAQELNPLLPKSCEGIALTKGAIAAGSIVALWHIGKEERHPKAARWIAIGATAATGFVVYHNFRQIQEGD